MIPNTDSFWILNYSEFGLLPSEPGIPYLLLPSH